MQQAIDYDLNFYSYLTGLIEALGTITVHKIYSKYKNYYPKMIIVFRLNDIPLAEKLMSITKAGRDEKKQYCAIWHLESIENVIKIIKVINGLMRTPKIKALYHAIHWFNNYLNTYIKPLPLDPSPVDSNGWLAGFSDGNSNFSMTLTHRKKKGGIIYKKVQAFFHLKLKHNYFRKALEQVSISYFNILSEISRYFRVNLYSRSRQRKKKFFYVYKVIVNNIKSHRKVIEYFDGYPLYSSKYLTFICWKHIVEQIIISDGKLLSENIQDVRAQFNKNHTIFYFSLLDSMV